ncbi:hypothetical protein ACL02T_19510 [Pseudonocardia sp. RS010]|uniref:hypothetical protein n=1 Tax=Pseudonocardia sp. RS010 TaxID=3385979 RepID=UPI0039A34F84
MMSFFEEALAAGQASLQPATLYARPAGVRARGQPPWDWVIPKIVPLDVRLGRSSSAVVSLDSAQCWPEGVSLSVRALMRVPRDLSGVPPTRLAPRPVGLHIGVVFADGRSAAYLDGGGRGVGQPPDPRVPLLVMGAGSRWGQFHRMVELYLTPLPPEGPLTVVVQWLEHEITETRTELDSGPIRELAATVIDVWPDLPTAPEDAGNRTVTVSGGASRWSGVAGTATVRREERRPSE